MYHGVGQSELLVVKYPGRRERRTYRVAFQQDLNCHASLVSPCSWHPVRTCANWQTLQTSVTAAASMVAHRANTLRTKKPGAILKPGLDDGEAHIIKASTSHRVVRVHNLLLSSCWSQVTATQTRSKQPSHARENFCKERWIMSIIIVRGGQQ